MLPQQSNLYQDGSERQIAGLVGDESLGQSSKCQVQYYRHLDKTQLSIYTYLQYEIKWLEKAGLEDSGMATETKDQLFQSRLSDKSSIKVPAQFRNPLCWETLG